MTVKKMKCISIDAVPPDIAPSHLTLGKVYEVDMETQHLMRESALSVRIVRDDGQIYTTRLSRFEEVNEAPLRKMLCVETQGAAHLVQGSIYDTRPSNLPGNLEVYVPSVNKWLAYLASRFIPDPSPRHAPTDPRAVAPAPKPTPPPTFVCRCVICDKKLENVIGLMAIAYPSPAAGNMPQHEMQQFCTACSAEVAAFVAHKKKPLPDPEDFW